MPIKDKDLAQVWWHTPLLPALGRQRQEDLCELEASLVYKESSRTARVTQENPVSQKGQGIKNFKISWGGQA